VAGKLVAMVLTVGLLVFGGLFLSAWRIQQAETGRVDHLAVQFLKEAARAEEVGQPMREDLLERLAVREPYRVDVMVERFVAPGIYGMGRLFPEGQLNSGDRLSVRISSEHPGLLGRLLAATGISRRYSQGFHVQVWREVVI